MDKNIILLPLFAQVALTAIVWSWMYYTRIKEIFSKKIPVQDLVHKPRAQELLKDVSGPSDNLLNLFEIPVLFYTVIILVHIENLTNYLYVTLAFSFVALRCIHSLIHITYNNVQQRFSVYFLSTFVLWILWLIVALEITLSIQW